MRTLTGTVGSNPTLSESLDQKFPKALRNTLPNRVIAHCLPKCSTQCELVNMLTISTHPKILKPLQKGVQLKMGSRCESEFWGLDELLL